ncbi:hypothetical protein CBER1_07663 [Cercospora berteroae]|uniref:Heterokaryon incompatibility domain-containing protein n=1 Tax=Cercospora berteroae TaxID=357750 RepID=A0A2S6C4L1_9PEZI|nr:hypothetical protein CBER1_07663 [Cercospora berteroae]
MWLLNARTRRLENFIDDRQMDTAYAILSHTWAKEEVGFDDIHHDRAKSMSGYRKINYACKQALKDGIGYVWVDTCCIDKKSSAELSEAINSIYRWYYNAQVCYAFLEDVWTPMEDLCEVHDRSTFSRMKDAIAASRWFTRGWTLQELIAPSRVEFYDMIWNPLGLKEEVLLPLSQITGISTFVLRDRNQLPRASIAQRMAWASDRTTSRLEDQAYCLLGLFDVNIPLMYGEGKKAFVRLQEEIIQSRSWEGQDHSILAFRSVHGDLLASSPGEFGHCNNILRSTLAGDGTFELSKRGLRISLRGSTLPVMGQDQKESDRTGNDVMVMLDCTRYGGKSRVGLRLRARPPIDRAGRPRLDAGREELIYDRLPDLVDLSTLDPVDFHRMEVTIARKPFSWPTVSRHLVIDCPEAVLHLDNVCTARNCGFSSQCLEQYWTNESGNHVVLSDDGKVGRGRIKMALGSDGKLFTDFKVKFPAPRSDTAGRAAHGSATLRSRECPDILVHVEADVKTLPPVLVAYCRSETSPSVDLAHQKLRVLPFGSPRTFKLDAGIDLHVKAGLSFETGDGVWRLDLSRAKLEAGCTTDTGAEDAPSTSAAEHRSSPCSDNHHSGSPGSAVQQTISDAAEVRALQQELSDLRDDLWFLYQKSLCDNEDLAQRLKNRLFSHRRSRGILPKGKSIASAFRKRARNTSSVAALHDDYVVVARPDETNAILEEGIFELEQ